MWVLRTAVVPTLQTLVLAVMASPAAVRLRFLLDPTSLPDVIALHQAYGQGVLDIIFYIIRTFVYGLHRKKLILVGRWPYSSNNENCSNQINPSIISGPALLCADVHISH